MESEQTIVDILKGHAMDAGRRPALTYLADGDSASTALTYADVDSYARAGAARLRSELEPGERVVVSFADGLEFIVALLACMYAGVIAVPVYPPRQGDRHGATMLRAAVTDCAAAMLWTRDRTGHSPEGVGLDPRLRIRTWQPLTQSGARDEVHVAPENIAILQYTSGSTSRPKGVMVSHANLLHAERMINSVFHHTAESTIVTWLPTYHDMGLIGQLLQAMFAGAHCVFMPPQAFLHKPVRWLKAVDAFHGQTSGGPNFAYDLCVQRIDRAECEALDLSGWTIAFNGAEPVRWATLESFAAAFADNGFSRSSFYPCYGLAEVTLFGAGPDPGAGARAVRVDEQKLASGYAIPDESGIALVACGHGWLDRDIRIVDPTTLQELHPGRVGEIWLSGQDVAEGYWARDRETERTFSARIGGDSEPYLRTGDLGFLIDGDLVVTGRHSDLIVIEGRNLYPHDIERSIEDALHEVRKGCCIAYEVDRDAPALGVVVEVADDVRGRARTGELIGDIRRVVAAGHSLPVARVTLIARGTLPKTSSGKLRRRVAARLLLEGTLPFIAMSERAHAEIVLGWTHDLGSVQQWLADYLSAKLLIDPVHLDVSRSFAELGLKSADAIDVIAAASDQFGIEVDPLALWDHSTPAALARHIHAATQGGLSP